MAAIDLNFTTIQNVFSTLSSAMFSPTIVIHKFTKKQKGQFAEIELHMTCTCSSEYCFKEFNEKVIVQNKFPKNTHDAKYNPN